jgi:hypothetical protein
VWGDVWLCVDDSLVRDQVFATPFVVVVVCSWEVPVVVLGGQRVWGVHSFLHSLEINYLGEMMGVMAILAT